MKRVFLFFLLGSLVPSMGFAQLCESISEPLPTGNETLFGQLGGVQLWQRELTSPCEGFEASIIEARATNPGSTIGTLTNLRFENVHQLWSSVGLEPSILGPAQPSALFHQDWKHLDSHFLITNDMILGGVYTMNETNDGSTSSAISLPPMLNGASTPRGGYGSLGMEQPTDAFALRRDFFTDSLDIAYVVTQTDAPAPSKMTAGLLGDGIAWDGGRYGSTLEFGYNGNPELTFLPFVPYDPATWPEAPEPPPTNGFGQGGEPRPVPNPDLPPAVGTVLGPTTYVETYEGAGGFRLFNVPIEVAPAPDEDFFYSVDLVGVEATGDVILFDELGDSFQDFGKNPGFYSPSVTPVQEGDPLQRYQFLAGTSNELAVLFVGNEVGAYESNFKFTFNDGTVVDATLNANITEARPPFGGNGNEFESPAPVDCSGIARRPLPENGLLVEEKGCVELISIPVEVGNGLMATKLVARGVDPESVLRTLTNISISNAHQVWAGGGIQSAGGTALGKPVAGPTYHEDWIPLDSHLLISEDKIGGGIGLSGIAETNDGSTAVGEALPEVLGFKPMTGLGTLSMSEESDAFFMLPEFQTNMLDIAYIVSDGSESVELTLGILGSGIRDAGTEDGATFGYGDVGRISIPLSQAVPEPTGLGMVLMAGAIGCLLRRRDV